MTESEAIYTRHSVRAYQKKPIEPETVDRLNTRIVELNEAYDLHLQLITDTENVFSGMAARFTGWSGVPAYIAVVGKKRDDLDEVCGYAGELLVLYAQTLGLNTCWAGIFRRKYCKVEIGADERFILTIAIGYGVDQGKTRRSKKPEAVTDVRQMPDWFRAGIEAALLAPTAINQQKFFFTLDDGVPSAKVSANGPFVKLDLGIVKCHFELASGKKLL